MKLILNVLICGLICILPISVSGQRAMGDIVVAYRIDAWPFSEKGNDGGFSGFVVDFCEEAVDRTGFTIVERIPVTAMTRLTDLEIKNIDLVCDPTTITRTRAEFFDFSPIIFIANSSFLSSENIGYLSDEEISLSPECTEIHRDNPERQLVGVGMLAQTTANSTYDLARNQRALFDTPEFSLCRLYFGTHVEGIAAACNGRVSHYFGDVDILRAQSQRINECEATIKTGFLAYEPYAFVLPSTNADFRRKFVSATYSIFADGTADKFYEEVFGTRSKSKPLEMLFRINSIPLGGVVNFAK